MGCRTARKDPPQLGIVQPHVLADDQGQRFAEVRGHRQVTPLVEIAAREPRPLAINPTAAHAAAHHPHDVAMAVVGAVIAIFMYGAAELREDHEDRIIPRRTKVLRKAGEPIGERQQVTDMLDMLAGRWPDVAK